ncbi:serine/threonine-protein kinase [bacterium]|nr:MAG: serine/threonine-protein kinase [bacterium]
MIGKTILHYKILEKLGEGGMGVVYKALDTKLNREVAIKFLPHHIAPTEEERERFKIEAQAAAALNHPNIATIYAVEEVDGETFIVMEFIKGRELKDIIHSNLPNFLSFRTVLDYAAQIADGLQAAHEEGVIHRDIKSANIMITEKDRVKIMDFGLAKLIGGAELTKKHSTLGTAAYMSPEQGRGDDIDHRTDIWSFGVVLYEMLTGQWPFRGEYDSAVLYSIMNEAPEAIATVRSDIPTALEQIVYKCLAKKATDRYETPKHLLNDLNKLTDKSLEQKPGHPTKIITRRKKSSQYIITAILIILAIASIAKFGLLRKKIKEPKIFNLRAITTSASIGRYGTQISPDGAYITYESNESGNLDIWVQQISSGQKINLTKDYDGRDAMGRWSPEGNWLAFQSTRDDGGIYMVSKFGGLPRKIVAHKNLESVSCWSPDGLKLTYTVAGTLCTVPVNGGMSEYIPLAHECISPYWSPDGDRIVYVTGNPNPYKQLWAINPDGSDPVLVLEKSGLFQFPQWSNDGNRIFFKSMKGGSRDIWWVPVDRKGNAVGSARQLTFGADAYEFSISKDGSHLAYMRDRGYFSICTIPHGIDRILNIIDATQILSQKEGMDCLALSPDHQWLAFQTYGGGKSDIWLARTNGQDLTPLTVDGSLNTYPSFSPDGKWIAFNSERNGNNDIYIMPVAGGQISALTHDLSSDQHPSWSVDGKKIIFHSDRSGNWDLWSVSVNGGDLQQLTFSSATDYFPTCSPDGHYVCFISNRTGMWEPYLLSTAGGDPKQLTEIRAHAIRGSWAPDGRTIYFNYYLDVDGTDRKIAAVSVEDGSIRKIMEFNKGDNLQGGLVADGEKLFFVTYFDDTDIWLADLVYE